MVTVKFFRTILTSLLPGNSFLCLLVAMKRVMLFLLSTTCMPCLMKSGRGNTFLIEFGLGQNNFGPFEAVVGHFLKLVTVLEKDVKLMNILGILFLNLIDAVGDIPKPHFHLLYLQLANFLLREALPIIV